MPFDESYPEAAGPPPFSPSSGNPWDSIHMFSPAEDHAPFRDDPEEAPPPQQNAYFATSRSAIEADQTTTDQDENNPSGWSLLASFGHLLHHRAPYYIPIFAWGPQYTWRTLGKDALAGLTVAFVLIPQALSYASQLILLEPIVGLYAAFTPLLVYALFGTSKHFAAGPEALTAILTGASVNAGETFEQRMADTILITLLVGLFTLLMGIFRLGFLDAVLSRSLLRGFISAVAIAVSIEQLPALLGLAVEPGHAALSPAQNFVHILHRLFESHPATAILSGVAILLLWGIKWLKASRWTHRLSRFSFVQHVPEILVVVTLGIFFSAVLHLHARYGVAILGASASKTSWPQWQMPTINVQRIEKFASPAALISIIGFFEATITVKHLAARHAYSISINRELVALGLMNCVGSFWGAFPTYGSLARSLVMVRSGGQTQASGFITGLFMLLTMAFVLPIFYYLPRCVMAAVIFTAVLSLLEVHDIAFMVRIHAWRDLSLCALTFCMTLFFSITFGVLVSIVLSLLITMRQTSQPNLVTLGAHEHTDGTVSYIDVTEKAVTKQIPGTVIIKVDASLYFSNTAQMADRLRRLETFEDPRTHPSETTKSRQVPITSLIFEMSGVHYVDASAMQVLCEVVEEHVNKQVQVKFVHLKPANHKIFSRSGLIAILGEAHFHHTIPDALEAIREASIHVTVQ